ncbi:MAG: ribosomal L7Ae/L30e/S12e/Gadd45 family protein [Firmicutes bacterium]|nr:ribosomal L7Ae/L30e/S12e/Gadd45 family protein [Bacillota bacterium]MBR6701085.1 ribosomal L7Ae/L30e/S12e/Gadd45 family protein [Bacillota bacterium]
MNNKLKSYLGFAVRSRNLVSGYDTCINLIKIKKIKLILITKDASEKTLKRFRGLTENAGIPMYIMESSEEMAEMTGIEGRNIFGITDKNFAQAIAKEIEIMRK